jgi:hypothetical protein
MKKIFEIYIKIFFKLTYFLKKNRISYIYLLNIFFLLSNIFINNHLIRINMFYIYFINLELIIIYQKYNKIKLLKNSYYIFNTNYLFICLILILLLYSNIFILNNEINDLTLSFLYMINIFYVISIVFISKFIKFYDVLKN